MKDTMPSLENVVGKALAEQKSGALDLSTTEDLSIAVMHLISLEEHFVFTALKTKKSNYFAKMVDTRQLRKQLLKQLMPNHEGETWCASKHLLGATMRLIEVGNKLMADGKKLEARDTFAKAYQVYTLFWALKLDLVAARSKNTKQSGQGLDDLVKSLADCCNE